MDRVVGVGGGMNIACSVGLGFRRRAIVYNDGDVKVVYAIRLEDGGVATVRVCFRNWLLGRPLAPYNVPRATGVSADLGGATAVSSKSMQNAPSLEVGNTTS